MKAIGIALKSIWTSRSRRFKVGDRVRFKQGQWGAAKPDETGYKERILLAGAEGTVLRLVSWDLVAVKWDAGKYKIYKDIVQGPRGLEITDKGTVDLPSITTSAVNAGNIEKIAQQAKP